MQYTTPETLEWHTVLLGIHGGNSNSKILQFWCQSEDSVENSKRKNEYNGDYECIASQKLHSDREKTLEFVGEIQATQSHP